MITEIGGLLGLEPDQAAGLSAANADLHEAIEAPRVDVGRMQKAWATAMGYVKLADTTALRKVAIDAGNQAGNELEVAIHHMHL